MKKFFKNISIFVVLLIAGIVAFSGIFPKTEQVSAETTNKEFVNLILTGGQDYYPYHYFDTLEQSTYTNTGIEYYNKNGEVTSKYRAIKADVKSLLERKNSTGEAYVSLLGSMKTLATTGRCFIYATAGLIAKDSSMSSRVIISLSANGQTVEATSNKVYSASDIYDPEWVQTERIYITDPDEAIKFSFTNKEGSSAWSAADFLIFEPTITFGIEVDEITTSVSDQNVAQGQLLELKASNFLTSIEGRGDLLAYYKNYHKIEWEIIEGSNLGYISGSYLKVTGNSGTIKVRAKCRANSGSDNYIYSQIITLQIDNTIKMLTLDSNFPEGAVFSGGGAYSINDVDTAILTEVKSGYTFLKYVDDQGNEIQFTKTAKGFFRAIIDLDRSKTITAILIKDVKIDEIVVQDKYYDKTDAATITDIAINGILSEHDITIENNLSAKFSSVLPEENIHISVTGDVWLTGSDLYMYNFDSILPDVRANILKRTVYILANSAQKEYGTTDTIFTYSLTGDLLSGDNLTGQLSRESGENIGEYQMTLGTLDNPNYNIVFTSNVFTITKRQIEVTNVVVLNKIYDQTTAVNIDKITLTQTGVITNEKAVLRYEATYENSNAGVNLLISFRAWIEGEEKDFYELTVSAPEIRGDILARQLTITAEEKSKTYGEFDPPLTYTFNQSDILSGDIITGQLSRSVGEDAGTYKINIGTLNIANYEINFISADLIINKKTINVKTNESGKIYGDIDPALTYEVMEEDIDKSSVGLILKRGEGENVGTYDIQIESQLNLNYNINFTSAEFAINKRNLTINISLKDKDYDGKTSGTLSVEMINLRSGDQLSVGLQGYFDSASVGDRTVYYYLNGTLIEEFDDSLLSGEKSNYEIVFNVSFDSEINKKEVIVRIEDTSTISKIYGEEDRQISYMAEGVAEGESLVGQLARTPGENAGSYSISQGTLTNENNSNYSIIFDCDDFYTILKRDVKIVVDSKNIIFGENEGVIEYYLSSDTPLQNGVLLNDLINGTPSRESGNTHGQYKYILGSLVLKQAVRGNYTLIFEGGYLTINKRPIEISIENSTKTYGESDPVVRYQIISGTLANLSDLTFKREKGENVGNYTTTAVLIDSYELISNSATLTISPAELAIKASNLIKTYGNTDPILTYVITKGILMFEDTFETVFEGKLDRVSGENVGTYTINQGELKANINYSITFESGYLVIQKRNIVVNANPVSKFLDEQLTPEFTYQATGLVENDVLNGELSVEQIDGLGEYDILIGTLNSDNYNITFISAKYSIVKRTLSIIIDYVSKEYDGTGSAQLTYSFSGDIAEGDEDNLGIVLTKENGSGVGRYLITATASNEKYEVSVTTNYFEILPRKLTIKAGNITITYGDNIPDSDSWEYSVEGQIINNELSINLYRTQNYCVGEFEILATITNTSNYDVTFIPGKLTIKKKTIYITVSNYQKMYSQSDPIFEYIVEDDGLYSGDVLQGTITREEGKNVGEYKLICSLINDNYNIIMKDAKLTITQKELVIVTSALDKIFDGTDVAYLRSPVVSGVVEGDDVTFDYNIITLARFENPAVGDNKKVIVYGGELIGEDAGNYYLTRPIDLTASITNSIIDNGNGGVSISAPKTNTKLKIGTTLYAEETEANAQMFSDTKNVINACTVSLFYNNEVFENYGTLTVSIDLGNREFFNVQLYKLKEDGTTELVKSKYENGKVVFDTDVLGTYIVIADNDNWIDITLVVIASCFLILTTTVFFTKRAKNKKSKQ